MLHLNDYSLYFCDANYTCSIRLSHDNQDTSENLAYISNFGRNNSETKQRSATAKMCEKNSLKSRSLYGNFGRPKIDSHFYRLIITSPPPPFPQFRGIRLIYTACSAEIQRILRQHVNRTTGYYSTSVARNNCHIQVRIDFSQG